MVQVLNTVSTQEGMPKVKEYARQALAADEGSAEAHASMGAGGRISEAIEQDRVAMEVDPLSLIINMELCFDALRDDARFQALVRRAGLTPRS